MSSLLSNSEKSNLANTFDDIFDTFKRDIVVFKEPMKVISSINESQLFGYGPASNLGNYEYVPDAIDGSDHSPFATTLLSLLAENDDYLLADELFSNLEKNINFYPTNQTPRFGSLILPPGHHDPTGDFIFVPKNLRKG